MEKKDEKKKILISLVAIAGIIILSYIIFPGNYKKTSNISENLEVSNPIVEDSGDLRIISDIVEEEADSYIINAKYPIIEGLDNSEKEMSLNRKIKSFIDESISDFKKQTNDGEISEEIKSGFYINFETTYLSKNLLSIKFTVSEYYAGAAHPNDYILAFNYNIADNRGIMLEEIFLPDSSYLDKLSDSSRSILFDRFEDDIEVMQDWIETGTEPEEENFEDFGIKKDSLIIYFKSYQIGPYAIGVQEIKIMFKDLDGYIDLEYLGF
ncbi:MAG: DUF3298 and DUF4163 domain-containing protein [Patescibacteria group bacterium]|nr:DUF3298 and DUF4163 domain-containing protein [Patescibacteria group bacterium]